VPRGSSRKCYVGVHGISGRTRSAILRSLDALHLASASSLADELVSIVTYEPPVVAAGPHGVGVVAPSGE
jgi:hypothetical protein